jgi:hypothetical protein
MDLNGQLNQPENNTTIEELHIEPWKDGQRIRVHLTLSESSIRPNLEAVIFSATGDEIQRVHIIENMDARLVFTMHLRGAETPGDFELSILVYLDPDVILDQKTIAFNIPSTSV